MVRVNRYGYFCILTILIVLFVGACSSKKDTVNKIASENDLFYSYMDPMIGTGGHVHTFPGATFPFGMIQLSPDVDTKGWDWCAGYHYSDTNIKGFSHNHLSGTGWSDLGDILLMPGSGKYYLNAGDKHDPDQGWRSHFSHKQEKAVPGYYQVELLDNQVNVELTANKRTGFHRYTFHNQNEDRWVVVDPTNKIFGKVFNTSLTKENDHTVSGFCHSTGWAGDRYLYFAATFSEPISEIIFTDGSVERRNIDAFSDDTARAILFFDPSVKRSLEVKVAISGVSVDGAKNNLLASGQPFSFDDVKKKTINEWKRISRVIQVHGGSESQKRIFYTGLYHNFIAPNLWMDTDGSYTAVGKIMKTSNFNNYSTFSTWDTFRATFPLLSLIEPKKVSDMANSLISRHRDAKDHMPLWELLGHDNTCMIGNPATIFIYDALRQGVSGIDKREALDAMIDLSDHNKLSSSDGPGGVPDYIELGYVPSDIEKSVSKTLEYAYADDCIQKLALELGDTVIAEEYAERAKSYKKLFNHKLNRFWPKKRNGEWVEAFATDSWEILNNYWVSGNVWAYDYFVPHQMKELIELKGGFEAFEKDLDHLFTTPLNMVGEQHVDISGFIGGYAHGDEPGHANAYLYNYVGAPYKTQKYVRQIMKEMYKDTPDGMINNEDCGQMSAWYIFSAMGFYPVVPGSNSYLLGSPIFDQVKIMLPNGKCFEMIAHNQSDNAIYVDHVKLNGKDYSKLFITTEDILSGAKLEFFMSEKPNKEYGNHPEDWPL